MINNILTIILYIVISFIVLLFLAWIYNLSFYLQKDRNKIFSPRFYLKEIPFLLNKSAMYRVSTAGQFLGIILLSAIVAFTFMNNIGPLDVTVKYSLPGESDNISQLGPTSRVKVEKHNGYDVYKQIDDLIYFSTDMPLAFETASVSLRYKTFDPDQTLSLGFKDQDVWHYKVKPFEAEFLNLFNWAKNGYDPVLYQRDRKYNTSDEFFENPPVSSIIGTFEYEPSIGKITNTRITSYIPQKQDTVINTALRGRHTMYVYLENEPFRIEIYKQDLNWYEDKDEMNIKVYKSEELVHEVTASDDGIQNSSRKVLPPQGIIVKNPGEELPESGVYKIVIETNGDTVIKKIKTNLHKIVFANSIFPIANHEVYPSIVSTTSATKVFTNALTLFATTYHDQGKQNILVGNQVLGVDTLHSASYLAPKDNIAEVVIPQNDVVLNGFLGYFAFSRDQFFLPTKYHILPITKAEDVELVDYILTDYLPSRQEGEWQVNEQTFDLRTAYIKDGKLSWIIKAPKLKERNGEIIIKDIQITFHKKGWL